MKKNLRKLFKEIDQSLIKEETTDLPIKLDAEMKAERVCKECGSEKYYAKGLCGKCYMRKYRTGKSMCWYCRKTYKGEHECKAIKIDAGKGVRTYYKKADTKRGCWVETSDGLLTVFLLEKDYQDNVGKKVLKLTDDQKKYNRNIKKQKIGKMLKTIGEKYGYDEALESLDNLYDDLKDYYYRVLYGKIE